MPRLLTSFALAAGLGLGLTADADAQPGAQSSSMSYYPTSVCNTPAGSCLMVNVVPAGSFCTCFTPYGPVNGRAG